MKLKKFGDPKNEHVYDLAHCIGHIEARCSDEEETMKSDRGPKAVRLDKVRRAVQLLEEAYAMGNEE